jgi:2-oxoisovalerate dehydrogenase E2 component (dihydrolipoyl transacylase)
MGRYVFKLPDIGEGIAESEIAEWHVAVGDQVEEDQILVDMLTDKAAVEIPAAVSGTVLELGGAAGDTIAVGDELIVLDVEGYESETKEAGTAKTAAPEQAEQAAAESKQVGSAVATAATQASSAKPEKPPERTHTSSPAPSSGPPRPAGDKPLAAPSVRRRARDYGVRLAYVHGTGPANRITHADLDAFMAGEAAGSAVPTQRRKRTGVSEIRVIGLRRKIAQAMQDAKRRIPHFAYVEELDVTELENLRKHLNSQRSENQPKLTLLPFLIKALERAVLDFPEVNATYDDEAEVVTQYEGLHTGIAAQTDKGLVVPVIKHAETLDLWDTAAEVKRLAEAARAGTATRDELAGSSITVTSLGPLGGIASTPVINAPEVAIIGVNKIVERPAFVNGAVVPRLTMNLSSSFDHRIVDGFNAASFIQRLKSQLEHPATLFLD